MAVISKKVGCPKGFIKNGNGACVPDSTTVCGDGQHKDASGNCVPNKNTSSTPAKATTFDWSQFGLNNNQVNNLLGQFKGLGTTNFNPISSLINASTNQKEYDLAKAKQDAELAATKAALERATSGTAQQLTSYEDLLKNIGIPDAVKTAITNYGTNAGTAVGNQYDNLTTTLQNLYQGEGGTQAAPTATSALGLTQAGYAALQNYLTNNPATAYTQAKLAGPAPAPQVSNDLAQYMQSQGVDAGRVQPGLLAAQAAAQGGATNYQNLLNTLAATEAGTNTSRQSELEMAKTLANAGLTGTYTKQQGALTAEKLAALTQIAQQQAQYTLQAEQAAAARKQAIEDAIAKLKGTGYVPETATECGAGQEKDASGKCVPITTECGAGQVKDANGNCVPITNSKNGLTPEVEAQLAERRGGSYYSTF